MWFVGLLLMECDAQWVGRCDGALVYPLGLLETEAGVLHEVLKAATANAAVEDTVKGEVLGAVAGDGCWNGDDGRARPKVARVVGLE